MNWFSLWLTTLLRREPPTIEYDDAHELEAAKSRQSEQRIALEVLERELATYRRGGDAAHS